MKNTAFFSRRELLGALGRLMVWLGVLPFIQIPRAGARELTGQEAIMKLPQPRLEGNVSVEKAIYERRTVRSFRPDPLSLEQLSQLLWAAQGVTGPRGFRAAPSAGALYPMDVYAVVGAGSVGGMDAGVYRYRPGDHSLEMLSGSDTRDALARACLGQMWMARAPVNLVITAEYARVCGKYGDRGVRYGMIEAGHVGTNIFLQAEAAGLGAGIAGAFRDRDVIEVMKIPGTHEPLLVMPVGYRG